MSERLVKCKRADFGGLFRGDWLSRIQADFQSANLNNAAKHMGCELLLNGVIELYRKNRGSALDELLS